MNARFELLRVLAGIKAGAIMDCLEPSSISADVDEARRYLSLIPTGDLNSDQLWEIMLEWRDIEKENACGDCGGSGKKTYADTSTYHHGIGGQMLTTDVCDCCWGSGNIHNKWPRRE